MKFGKSDISNTNTKDKTYTIGGGLDKNGKKYGKLGYDTKDTNKKAIKYGDKEISKSDYTAKGHEATIGIKKGKKGTTVDGSYSKKDIIGQKYSVGKTSYTRENEVGNKYSGSAHVGKNNASAKGGVEKYKQQTQKVKVGTIETSYSKKDYKKVEGNVKGKYKNGVFKGKAGGSYANGQTHTGKIGDSKVTVGHENKVSGNAGIKVSKNNVNLSGKAQKSNTYSGELETGKVKIKGSASKTQTVKGNININKNGVNAKGSHEQKYQAGGSVKVGKNSIGIKGGASSKTSVGAGVNINKNGGSVNAHAGKEYKAGANVKVNGKEVAKVNGNAKGQVNAKVGIDKKKGFNAHAGAKGQAKAEAKIGKIDAKVKVSSDLKVDAKIDKKGVHVDVKGGIHAGVDVKNTKTGKEIHIGGDAKGKAGANVNKGKVTTNVSRSTKVKKGNNISSKYFKKKH